jgi:hypothetical protein
MNNRTETAAGVLEGHRFGPFAADENLQGPNGVSRCSGGQVSEDAAALVGRAWPLVTGVDPDHGCKTGDYSENDVPF